MKSLAFALSTLMGLSACNTYATESKSFDYFGVRLENQSFNDVNFAPGFDTEGLAPLSYSAGQSGQGIRLLAGRQFNHYIALEGGISSFGEADFKVAEAVTGADGKVTHKGIHSGKFRTYGLDARVVATYPFENNWYLKGHLGALLWQNEFSYLSGTPAQTEVKQVKDSGVSMLAGFGVGYGFNENWTLSVDFEKTEVADIETKTLGVSVLFQF